MSVDVNPTEQIVRFRLARAPAPRARPGLGEPTQSSLDLERGTRKTQTRPGAVTGLSASGDLSSWQVALALMELTVVPGVLGLDRCYMGRFACKVFGSVARRSCQHRLHRY